MYNCTHVRAGVCVCSVAYTHACMRTMRQGGHLSLRISVKGVFVGEGSTDPKSTLAGLGCRGLGYFFNNQDLEMMGRQVNSVGHGID
jgi:hypothetical protein